MDTKEGILHEISVEGDAKSIEEVRHDVYDAVIKGSFDVSKNFTVEGKDVLLKVTSIENTVLHIAAIYGENDVAQQTIQKYPSLLYRTNMKGDTPLHIAASLGDLKMTKFLLECAKGERDIEAKTPLIKMLNREKDTALHVAVRKGYAQIVDLLIAEDGGLTSITNNAGESPLFLAVDGGFDEIADSILQIPGCSYGGRKGMNVLHAAVIRKDRKKTPPVRLEGMLKKFGDAMVEADEFGWIPLHYAAYFGDVKVVELFLDENISLAYKTDGEGMSAIHISAKKGHVNVVNKLIEKCPDTCELLDSKDRTALHVAVENGHKYFVLNLLQKNRLFQYLIDKQDKDGNTPFHLAAIKKHYALLKNLADYMGFASMAMNKEGMSTFDIIQSDNTLTSEEKGEILKMLNADKCLERVVHIRTTKKQTVKASAQVQTEQSNQEIEEKEEPGVFGEGTDASHNGQVNLENFLNANIVVATLVATVTFAAAFQVPGGYDDNGHPILSEKKNFIWFMIFDSLAFGFSAASAFIQFFASIIPKKCIFLYPKRLILLLNELGIMMALGAFLCGVRAVLAEKSSLAMALGFCALGSFLCSIMGILIILWVKLKSNLKVILRSDFGVLVNNLF